MKDYYKILEIESSASTEEVKSQYKLLIQAWHPDKFVNSEQKLRAEEKLKEINEAYSIIGDNEKRKVYNEFFISPQNTKQNSSPENIKSNCESCGLPAETKYAEFHENIGMLIMRKHRHVKGYLCKSCVDHYFWDMTGKTMILGWWGVISIIVTPFLLLNNLIRFILSIGMKKPVIQLAPSPSVFWIFTSISGYIVIGFSIFMFTLSILSSLSSNNSSFTSPQNTSTSPIVQPTKIKTPTLPSSNCILWSQVTPSMIGKTICTYGKVYDTKFVGESSFQVLFSNDPYSFFLAGGTYYYDLSPGDCVLAEGKVLESGVGVPYIDIDEELLFCEPWMEK